jgi:hypothetical protein
MNSTISDVLSSSLKSVPRPDTLIGVDELIRKRFVEYRSSCFGWLLKATALVVVGLGFEGAELWYEIPSIIGHWRFRRRFHFSLPEFHPPNWTILLAFIGWFCIVLGVAGEYVADSFVSKADGYIQTFDEILIGDAASNAIRAQNAADAVDEKTQGIDERLKRASRLLDMLGPRWNLLEQHKSEFIKDMARFNEQKIFLVSCGMTGGEEAEANQLQRDLRNFLGKFDEGKNDGAGWVVDESQVATWHDCTSATAGDPPAISGGIVLVLSDTSDIPAKRSAMAAAKALEDELSNKVTIVTRIAGDTKLDNAAIVADAGTFWKSARETLDNDPKAVFLLVGPNPLFILTNPKKTPK